MPQKLSKKSEEKVRKYRREHPITFSVSRDVWSSDKTPCMALMVGVQDEDGAGGGTRICGGKISGRWTDLCDWPLTIEKAEWVVQEIQAAIRKAKEQEEARKPQHVCGLQGYNPMLGDPPCPRCEWENEQRNRASS